jgi:hypothetical protein
VYEDTIKHVAWHQCKACGIKGDMLQLLCAVWKVTPETALLKLRCGISAGMPTEEEWQQYQEEHVDYTARLDAFWEASRQYLQQQPAEVLGRLRYRFQLNALPYNDPRRWLKGPGQFIGGYPCDRIEQVFMPKAHEDMKSQSRIFKGADWRDAVVFPYHDLPGRICGFLFMGKGGEQEAEVFKLLPYVNGTEREAGICGMSYIDASQDSVIVAVSDVVFMAWLQMRHLRDSDTLLPMVAWYAGKDAVTCNAWRALPRRRLIFWSFDLDAHVLVQAISTNAELAICGPSSRTGADVSHYVREAGTSADLLRRVERIAEPWQSAIARWLRSESDGRVEDLITSLERNGVSPSLIASVLDGEEQKRFHALASSRLVPDTSFAWHGLFVKETVYGTFVHIDGQWQQVANCRFRVSGHDAKNYYGKLLLNEREHPFQLSIRSLLRRTCIEKLETSAKVTVLSIKPGWLPKLIRMSYETGQLAAPVEPGGDLALSTDIGRP